jgi:hypothetical protein
MLYISIFNEVGSILYQRFCHPNQDFFLDSIACKSCISEEL